MKGIVHSKNGSSQIFSHCHGYTALLGLRCDCESIYKHCSWYTRLLSFLVGLDDSFALLESRWPSMHQSKQSGLSANAANVPKGERIHTIAKILYELYDVVLYVWKPRLLPLRLCNKHGDNQAEHLLLSRLQQSDPKHNVRFQHLHQK